MEIELDASDWRTVTDFYVALLAAIGAPEWHGTSLDALNDSMVWGGINDLQPPYTIRVARAGQLPAEVKQEVADAIEVIRSGSAEYRVRFGHEPGVSLVADF